MNEDEFNHIIKEYPIINDCAGSLAELAENVGVERLPGIDLIEPIPFIKYFANGVRAVGESFLYYAKTKKGISDKIGKLKDKKIAENLQIEPCNVQQIFKEGGHQSYIGVKPLANLQDEYRMAVAAAEPHLQASTERPETRYFIQKLNILDVLDKYEDILIDYPKEEKEEEYTFCTTISALGQRLVEKVANMFASGEIDQFEVRQLR